MATHLKRHQKKDQEAGPSVETLFRRYEDARTQEHVRDQDNSETEIRNEDSQVCTSQN